MRTLILLLAASLVSFAQTPAEPQKGSIQGTITDQSGQPIPQVRVQAMALDAGSAPKVLGETYTDSKGNYSLKFTPGRVLISASRAGGNSVTMRYVKDGDTERPQPVTLAPVALVYHPQAATPAEATPIEVSPGAEVKKIDFQVQLPDYGKIQGFTVRYLSGRD